MSTSTSVPAGDAPAGVDKERRNAIALAATVGGAGAVALAVPFVASFAPSERAKAAGAPVEFDVGGMAPGEMKTVAWRGLPVWVLRRTPEMLQSIRKVDGEVADDTEDTENEYGAEPGGNEKWGDPLQSLDRGEVGGYSELELSDFQDDGDRY